MSLARLSLQVLVAIFGAAAAFWLYNKNNSQRNHDCEPNHRHYHSGSEEHHPPNPQDEDGNSCCCICLNDFKKFEGTSLPCGHWLHTKCAELLFLSQVVRSCPLCRRMIE